MSATRSAYRLLSVLGTIRAAFKGPKALGRRVVRQKAHKGLARAMRRSGL
jgi:hypothetical protein